VVRTDDLSEHSPPRPRVAVLACGALAEDVVEVVRRLALPVDVHGVSALDHLDPSRIVEDVDARLTVLCGTYDRVVVVYGDCGTGGRLDEVIARHPAVRPAGVHCYEWFAGNDFARITAQQPGTYFLTDWLVRNWDLAVLHGLGLDRFPWLKDTYFRHLTHLLYLQQHPGLESQAEHIADYLGLPLEIRRTGTDPIEGILVGLLGTDATA
jgi:Protein of unknown function (DUF1638)